MLLTDKSTAAMENSAQLLNEQRTATVNRALQFYQYFSFETHAGAEIRVVHKVPAKPPWWSWLLYGPFARKFSWYREHVTVVKWT